MDNGIHDPLIAQAALKKFTQNLLDAGSTMNDGDWLIPVFNPEEFTAELNRNCGDINESEATALLYWVEKFGVSPAAMLDTPLDSLISCAVATVPGFWMDLPEWLELGCGVTLCGYLSALRHPGRMSKIDWYQADDYEYAAPDLDTFEGYRRTIKRIRIYQELLRFSLERLDLSDDPYWPIEDFDEADFENVGKVCGLAKMLGMTLDDLVAATSQSTHFFPEELKRAYGRCLRDHYGRIVCHLFGRGELPYGWEGGSDDGTNDFPSRPIQSLRDMRDHLLRSLKTFQVAQLQPKRHEELSILTNRVARNVKRGLLAFGNTDQLAELKIDMSLVTQRFSFLEFEEFALKVLSWLKGILPGQPSDEPNEKQARKLPRPSVERSQDGDLLVFGRLKKRSKPLDRAVNAMLSVYPKAASLELIGGNNSANALRLAYNSDEDWKRAIHFGGTGHGYRILSSHQHAPADNTETTQKNSAPVVEAVDRD